jgi:hypothetical protein
MEGIYGTMEVSSEKRSRSCDGAGGDEARKYVRCYKHGIEALVSCT